MKDLLLEIFATAFYVIVIGLLICRIFPFEATANAVIYLSGVIAGVSVFLLKYKQQNGKWNCNKERYTMRCISFFY